MSTAADGTGLTESQLTHQLTELGIHEGGVLLVHSSLRSLGKVEGGAATVLRTLRRVLGPDGTVVVPAFTSDNSSTSNAHMERVRGLSDEARAAFRDNMPPFDPATTPSTDVGILAETTRLHPQSLRSAHPQTSFAALGPQAAKITDDHHPDCLLGESSPLARLYELGAQILLLGVGFNRCTAFHLGEYRVDSPPHRSYRCVIRRDGRRQWWEYDDVALDDSDFGELGAEFEGAGLGAEAAVRVGTVGVARCRVIGFADAVDYAQRWFPKYRGAGRR
ncbi:aminoglycoside N(3)-acetyltransferase [Streptomyces sp. NBC_00620]|uniref:aminoglycoside N(3)-acetyltransferase n=1 Tax=Streptomyces sp. NBC_00620 TaxID=2903666 RepID=UPI00225312D9|nr:AAC(3) family N-acetyltransferase [Streptomyces sp. NBC_00620]MCX4975090.1 AAC(3) family N-acetyltransferase [Streptomyces sp. NBC_00620]